MVPGKSRSRRSAVNGVGRQSVVLGSRVPEPDLCFRQTFWLLRGGWGRGGGNGSQD